MHCIAELMVISTEGIRDIIPEIKQPMRNTRLMNVIFLQRCEFEFYVVL